jgi:hypothetical protein
VEERWKKTGFWAQLNAVKQVIVEPKGSGKLFDDVSLPHPVVTLLSRCCLHNYFFGAYGSIGSFAFDPI